MATSAAMRLQTGLVTGLCLIALLGACKPRELILPGERFNVRTPLDASVPVDGQPAPVAPPDRADNISQPISLPAASANPDWTHRAGNSRHLMPHGALSASPQRVFSANIGAGSSRRNRIAAAPIVADGRIYTIDGLSGLVATSTSGARLWAVDLTAQFDKGGKVSGGGLAYGGGRLFAATGYGEVVAVDPASGAVIWRQRFDAPVMGAPTVDNGVVYVSGRDGAAFALTADTGRVLWDIPGTPNEFARDRNIFEKTVIIAEDKNSRHIRAEFIDKFESLQWVPLAITIIVRIALITIHKIPDINRAIPLLLGDLRDRSLYPLFFCGRDINQRIPRPQE